MGPNTTFGSAGGQLLCLFLAGHLILNCSLALPTYQETTTTTIQETTTTTNDLIGESRAFDHDTNDLRTLASDSKNSLVSVSSYLILIGDDVSGFLPLKLVEFQVEQLGKNAQKLHLEFDCATMMIYVLTNRFDGDYSINSIRMELTCSQEDGTFCENNWLGVKFSLEQRYLCPVRQVFTCYTADVDGLGKSYSRPVAEIVFDHLELEVNGNKNRIRRGEFSKPVGQLC